MKKDRSLVLFSSTFALCLLIGAYYLIQLKLTPRLPPTPKDGLKEMIRLMKAQDIQGVRQISTPKAMNSMAKYQGSELTNLAIYDHLLRKSLSSCW